ncbi:MAG: magnesium/cobalt transporter CorA [Microscillaceae bacterium]|nr:magnesium/cobalt transporter CorA [Microscillaceae bacterium]
MSKKIKHKSAVGQPPGTLTYIGEKKNTKVKISLIDYTEAYYKEKVIKDIRECYELTEKPSVSWINIDGVHDTQIVKTLGMYFRLHPLMLEDIVDTGQRPKVDFYEENIFVVLQMLTFNEQTKKIDTEQVSLILGQNFLLSFQEDKTGDVFEGIRERLRKKSKGSKLRNSGADYLFYLLIDTIVDHYFLVLEGVGEELEALEANIIHDQTPRDFTKQIYEKKRQLSQVKKSALPLRETVARLIREEEKFFSANNFYLRDLYDHTIQVLDTTESYIDVCSNLMDLFLSFIGNKTNDVMKILTIFSTIFLPLTFIAGVYGMNFKYMPELESHYGYFMTWVLMISVAVGAVLYFKKQKWL